MTNSKEDVAVIMIPLPSQSHLNRLLQLAVLVSSHRLPVHFIGSATHNRQAKSRAAGLPPSSLAKIHFHDFPTPPIDENTPHQQLALAKAYMNFRPHVGKLAAELSSKARKIIVICDMFVAEAAGDAASMPNVEYYSFHILSAVSMYYVLRDVIGDREARGGDDDVAEWEESLPRQMIEHLIMPDHYKDRAGDVYNTTRLMEGMYIDLMERDRVSRGNMTQWAVGANLVAKFTSGDETIARHGCLEWLDKQAPRSVMYVSFGTNVSLSEEEARELALGLEQSNQKFIWVVRGADKADVFSGDDTTVRLPEGFEERVAGRGLLVRDWAPQPEILAHKSTGGFMSHCGWNSCLESLTMGVPIAAWPLSVDQPLNALLLAEILKVGLIVREWRKRDEVVRAPAIRAAVERLMAAEEGAAIRRRAEELGGAIKKSLEEGGGACKELGDFIAHIVS